MKKGQEPMRSFSDLAQFFGTTQAEPEPSKKPKKRKGGHPKPATPESPADEPKATTEVAPPVEDASKPPAPTDGGQVDGNTPSPNPDDATSPDEPQNGDA